MGEAWRYGLRCKTFFTCEVLTMGFSLSYREKSLYASLVAELIVYGPYFVLHHQNTVNKVAGMIVSIIALQVILQTAIAVVTRNRMTDERDSLIELRGYRAGYLTLASLMVVGLGLLWMHATYGQLQLDSRMIGLHFLNVFFGMLVISDIVKTVAQIAAYRRAL
jgi:hypothetical protein